MKKRASFRLTAFVLAILLCVGCGNLTAFAAKHTPADPAPAYPYLDTGLSFEERALDLVSRMTQEEKYAQLYFNAPAIPRLGVEAYYWSGEALHGVANWQATSFPTAMGIAASWDTELVQKLTSAISDEARELSNNGYNTTGLDYWSPTINMGRDPFWGRAEETYGEDPFLTGTIAMAFVDGLQGDDPLYYKAISTPKHFLGNNSDQNRHWGSSNIDERDLREYYTYAFKRTIEDAKAGAIMSSYNAVNGVPVSVSEEILDGLLRRTWGFDGFVVTDCGALGDVLNNHGWRPEGWGNKPWTGEDVAAYAIRAGIDLNCGNILPAYTGSAIASGRLTEAEVDRALVRLFTARIKTGEFDPDGGPYGGDRFDHEICADDHTQLAETSADNGVILLQNKDNVLPLSGDVKNLVLVGDVADEVILGMYSTGTPGPSSTAEQGIRAALKRANPDATFTYISGTGVTGQFDYLMNTRNLKLLDGEGNVIRQIDLGTNTGTNNCVLEAAGNVGYISMNDAWMCLPAGTLTTDDVNTVKQFSVEMTGTGNCPPTKLEIRSVDPVNGRTLATFYGEGDTGGWGSYRTYTSEAGLGTGFDDQQLYLVWSQNIESTGLTNADKAAIAAADAVVYFAGTRPGENGFREESDGTTLDLPNDQTQMIQAVAALNANTIVYMQTVSQVNVEPFKDDVKAMLWSTYNGQAQGNAAGRILFGEVNPSAKLPFTWYTDVSQLADIKDYQMRADETCNGRTYQYFTGDVTYPFGYGLSYTTFAYSNLTLSRDAATPDDSITVEFDVKNTGAVAGQEVAQLYVASPDAAAKDRPVKRLKGFAKQEIAPGETAHYAITLNLEDLWYWDAENQVQTYDQGVYTIQVGPNSDAAANMSATFTLSGQLTPELHAATAIPSGHILDGNNPDDVITTELSASRDNQTFVDLTKAEVTYTSSNPAVAVVDDNGVVRSVGEGIATITASVTENGVTKTDSYPVLVTQNVAANNILLDGQPLEGFDPDVTSYSCIVTSLSQLPVVSAQVNEAFTVEVQQATQSNPTAVVTVYYGDRQVSYTIAFRQADLAQSFDFTNSTEAMLRSVWNVDKENKDKWTLDEKGLTITDQNGHIYGNNAGYENLFWQGADGDWVMETAVDLGYLPTAAYQQVSVMAFQDVDNYIEMHVEGDSGAASVRLRAEVAGNCNEYYRAGLNTTSLQFRMEKKGTTYTAFYCLDGTTWVQMGQVNAEYSMPKIGLLTGDGDTGAAALPVTFRHVKVTQMNGGQEVVDLVAKDILLNGAHLAEFLPKQMAYTIYVDSAEQIPEVTATADERLSVQVKQATAEDPTATVTVSHDGQSATYVLRFVVPSYPKSMDFTACTETELRNVWTVDKENRANWTLDEKGLTLSGQGGDIYMSPDQYENLFWQSADGNWTAEAVIEFDRLPDEPYQQVALFAFQDVDNYVAALMQFEGGSGRMMLREETGANNATHFNEAISSKTLHLRIQKDGDAYTLAYSPDGQSWTTMGTRSRSFAQPKLGLVAGMGDGVVAKPLKVTVKSLTVQLPQSQAAKQVVAQIDAIGTVTLDSEQAIVAARAAYDALSVGDKATISNLAVLEAAEAELARLKDEANVLAIVNQPQAFAGQIGQTATFHVDVTRSDVRYQWMYSNNGGKSFSKSTMPGADTATLTVEMKAFRVGQMYKCVVTDAKGNMVETEAVAMTTATTVAIVTDPADYTGAVGETATFTVEAQGQGLCYQWMYSNNEGRSWTKSTQPGSDTNALQVGVKAFRDGQMYRCVVTDASGNVVTSEAASIVIAK